MNLHERTLLVNQAKLKIDEQVWLVIAKYKLTYLEAVKCLNEAMSTVVMFGLRDERHPDDPEKRGDEA